MIFGLPAATVVNGASGLLLLALGVFAASVRPRRPGNVALAVMAAGSGLGWATNNLAISLPVGSGPRAFAAYLATAFFAVATVGLFDFCRRFGSGGGRLAVGVAAAVFAFDYLVQFAGDVVHGVETILSDVPWQSALSYVGVHPYTAGLWAGAFLFAARYRTAASRADARGLAVLSVAFAVYGAAQSGYALRNLAEDPPSVPGLAALLLPAYAASWLAGLRRPHPDLARNVVLVSLAVTLLYQSVDAVPIGVARTVGVVILAYAILRGQIPGLDGRVRWGLSKSTVAAVFIAVFFVASEAAQQFFGDQVGSSYVGIAAAGALVFALAPLHRAAERLAAKAVPATPAADGSRAHSDEETFRVALRKFLADGAVTRDEERHLARLATRLGISAERAHEIRDEVDPASSTR